MTTTYRYDNSDYASLTEAEAAVRVRKGWVTLAISEPFPVGSQEGKRGSVYGIACYETDAECDADHEGAHAPRILVIHGSYAWAMGFETTEV